MKKTTIYAAVITGICVIVAAIIGAYRWTPKPQTEGVVVAGMVIDQKTNSGVGHASIYVIGRPEQYWTEDNGNFRFTISLVKPATIRLVVSKAGFRTLDRTVQPPAEDLTLLLNKQ